MEGKESCSYPKCRRVKNHTIYLAFTEDGKKIGDPAKDKQDNKSLLKASLFLSRDSPEHGFLKIKEEISRVPYPVVAGPNDTVSKIDDREYTT